MLLSIAKGKIKTVEIDQYAFIFIINSPVYISSMLGEGKDASLSINIVSPEKWEKLTVLHCLLCIVVCHFCKLKMFQTTGN